MQAVELTLLSNSFKYDDIGQRIPKSKETKVPIISVQSIYHEEFYEANKQGLRPSIKFILSSLNYSGETDLIYAGQRYTVIRDTSTNPDEITLICERKIGDV
nr:MAG TPA: head closure knob [Caudoviricetes sp.]